MPKKKKTVKKTTKKRPAKKAVRKAPMKASESSCCGGPGPCYCSAVLALLVIIFVWMSGAWTQWAITIAAAILLLLSLTGTCCCKGK